MRFKANDPQRGAISGAEDREIGGERELERIVRFATASEVRQNQDSFDGETAWVSRRQVVRG